MSTKRSFRDLMAFWTSGTEWKAEQELSSLAFPCSFCLILFFPFLQIGISVLFFFFFFAFFKHLPIIALYCSFSHTPRISTVFKSQFNFKVRENLIAHDRIGIPCPDLIRCDYSKHDWQAPIPVCMYLESGEEGTF